MSRETRILRHVEDSIDLMEMRIGSGDYSAHTMPATGDSGTIHLHSMLERMQTWGKTKPPADSDKMATWLGYIQGCCVAHGLATKEDFRDINSRYRDEEP